MILSSGDMPSVQWNVAIEWEGERHLDLGFLSPIFSGANGTDCHLVLSVSFSVLICPDFLSLQFFSHSSSPFPSSNPPYPIPYVAAFAVVFAIVVAVAFLVVAAFVAVVASFVVTVVAFPVAAFFVAIVFVVGEGEHI